MGSKETPTLVTKATGRRRDTDETLMQHDVRASREAAGTSSSAVKSSIQKGTWLYRRQANSKLRACQNIEELTKEKCVEHCGRTSMLPSDQTGTESQSHGTVRRLLARASSIVWKHAGVCVRATAGGTAGVDEQIGTGAEARTTSGNSAICETCEGKQIENVANLTTEGSIQ